MIKGRLASSMLCAFVVAFSMQTDAADNRERFQPVGTPDAEAGATPAAPGARTSAPTTPTGTEAPTGFDNQTNGYLTQATFDATRATFEDIETRADGLGPTYNAQSCADCHQNVATGGASQVAEHRTGRMTGNVFFESLGGSLVQSRATYPEIVERVAVQDDIRTFRISTNTLGAGYIEAISNSTLLAIRDAQPSTMRGVALNVPILEASSAARIGRFGWKSQHASLQSFSADAYLNEMGITSPLFPDENTSSGRPVAFPSRWDPVPDPEDDGDDIVEFADFMRSTKAPSRGPITSDVQAGEKLFAQVGCATCHVASMTTAPAGTVINGGEFTIPAALGSKVIHPYSDFLLHDIGSGDGIPFLPTAEFASTANKMRTAPLWGLRTRNRLMHDGLSFTYVDVIRRHQGQAAGTAARANRLTATQKRQLSAFLDSL